MVADDLDNRYPNRIIVFDIHLNRVIFPFVWYPDIYFNAYTVQQGGKQRPGAETQLI